MVNFIYTKVKGVILKKKVRSLWLNFLCFLSLMCMDNKKKSRYKKDNCK